MHDFIEGFAPHLGRDLVSNLVLNEGQMASDSSLDEIEIPSY